MVAVYVGHDERETKAFGVCCASLRRFSSDVTIQPISRPLLGALYRRPTTRKGNQLWDDISNAPMSTDFSLARFWVAYMERRAGRTGPAIFCDGDFMWRAPVERLLSLYNSKFVVQVVKHEHTPTEQIKMDGQIQTAYKRKNWSSLMLINSAGDWPSLEHLNEWGGRDLHQFTWLEDGEIGSLPVEWNWLEGVSPPLDNPQAVHFTRGTPDMNGFEGSAFADEWRAYHEGR